MTDCGGIAVSLNPSGNFFIVFSGKGRKLTPMDAKETISKLIEDNPVMLFMKGTPEQPQCGFSAQVVQILNFLKVKYHTFDVLSDPEIRQGIKDYGNWPTIPQLYVNKNLLGGCDIVQEQFETGELEKNLSSHGIKQSEN